MHIRFCSMDSSDQIPFAIPSVVFRRRFEEPPVSETVFAVGRFPFCAVTRFKWNHGNAAIVFAHSPWYTGKVREWDTHRTNERNALSFGRSISWMR